MIFVKNFTRVLDEGENLSTPDFGKVEAKKTENQKSRVRKIRILDFGKPEVKSSEKPNPRLLENRNPDFGKTEGNNTENKNTDTIKKSIHQSAKGGMDVIDGFREQVKEQISYDHLMQLHPYNNDVGEIVELIVEVLCTQEEFMKIGRKQMLVVCIRDSGSCPMTDG